MRELTKKQEKFILEVAKGKSYCDAYRSAYNAKGMKDGTVYTKASLLAKQEKIRDRLDEIKQKAIQKTEDDAVSIQKFLVESYKRLAELDAGDFFDVSETAHGAISLKVKLDALKKCGFCIQEIRVSPAGKLLGVKFYDKDKALKALQDLYGIKPEEADSSVEIRLGDGVEELAE